MEKAIRRIIQRLFPELTGNYHLPRFAQVVAIRDPIETPEVCDPFRPKYAVDLQVLNSDLEPDTTLPVYESVTLPLNQGQFAYPEEGALVEVGFAYGMPQHLFVRTLLPHGLTLPELKTGEQLWQKNIKSHQKGSVSGNWERSTNGEIKDSSRERDIASLNNIELFLESLIKITGDSAEEVGGTKLIEALGAVIINSGGNLNLTAVDNVNLTTASDINSVACRDNRMIGKKIWVGNETDNVLKILSDVIQAVIDVNTSANTGLAPLTAYGASPTYFSDLATKNVALQTLKTTLDLATK